QRRKYNISHSAALTVSISEVIDLHLCGLWRACFTTDRAQGESLDTGWPNTNRSQVHQAHGFALQVLVNLLTDLPLMSPAVFTQEHSSNLKGNASPRFTPVINILRLFHLDVSQAERLDESSSPLAALKLETGRVIYSFLARIVDQHFAEHIRTEVFILCLQLVEIEPLHIKDPSVRVHGVGGS